MSILHSNWLVNMLKKSANTPEARLLSLFDILNDWSNAPGITFKPEQLASDTDASGLKEYLAKEAHKTGAALPDMLSNQLYFIALSAMQERLVAHNEDSLLHAKSAAGALITALTNNKPNLSDRPAYAFAASFLGALFVGAAVFFTVQVNKPQSIQLAAVDTTATFQPAFRPQYASTASTANLVAEIERMRDGNCRLIEAIQLPDQYKSIYFENIVNGHITTDSAEQEIVRELLAKIRCSYTPMLMKKST